MDDNTKCLSFIKDYILRFRFADIASHILKNTTELSNTSKVTSTQNILKKYEGDSEKIINDYENEVLKLCSKDNIISYCENNNTLLLKNKLDNLKKVTFDKIIKQYNSIDKYGYTSGSSSDFMLYHLYMDYITSENFIYDETNPYVVELLYKISTYINVRSRIELNKDNIKQLIINFNELCDEVLSAYWTNQNKDYFSELKKSFKYDFYSNIESIETDINDKNKITLYSKILDYLKALTNYIEPQSASEKYKNVDVNELLLLGNDEQSDEDIIESKKLKSLKRIAILFTILKKIDDDTDTSHFIEYIDENDLNNALTLKNEIELTNQTIDQIASSSTYKHKNHQETLKKYINALECITIKESSELRNICDKAINWYLENSHKIDDGTIFNDICETDWKSPMTIYQKTDAYDFYYIDKKNLPSEELKKALNEHKAPTEYNYTDDSLLSEYGIESYEYWLKYCSVATLVNCMLPMYWATGLFSLGAPVSLPIIFIPSTVISGRVTVVIGVALCGLCPSPMFIFMNIGDIPGFIIPTLNIVVDTLKDTSSMLMNIGKSSVKETIKGLINQEDNNINNLNNEIKIAYQEILNLECGIKEDKETLKSLRKKNNENTTSKNKKRNK